VQSTSATDLKWYVVQSKPREELRAEHFLKEKGFQVYLPLMEVAITRIYSAASTLKAALHMYDGQKAW
jgi:hypothetical protein